MIASTRPRLSKKVPIAWLRNSILLRNLWLLIVSVLVFSSPRVAFGFSTADLISGCQTAVATSTAGHASTLPELQWASTCYGFLQAVAANLVKTHEYYKTFVSSNDLESAKRLLAAKVILGPDACLPDDLTGAAMSRVIVARAAQRRNGDEDLTAVDFAASALAEAYGCEVR